MPAVETPSQPEAGLGRIVELIAAYRAARVLTAAVSLGVFDALAAGPLPSAELARRIGADPRASAILLDALAALGFVLKQDGFYRNAQLSQERLVKGAPGGLASNLRYQELLAPAWAELPAIVKLGEPSKALLPWLEDPAFSSDYIRGMADISRRPAAELAAALDLSGVRDALDVGGGPGVYLSAFCERAPELKGVLFDLPSTLEIAAGILNNNPHKERISLRAGDYHQAPFGTEAFDLVLFSHVTHDEGVEENRALFKKAWTALRPGGKVVVHDFMVGPDRTQPAFGALFAVHMLVYTRQGRTYSAEEYESWLAGAGFSRPRRIPICAGAENASAAIVAVKA